MRAQTLSVRIWNSLNLQVEPTMAAVTAFLIGVTVLILGLDGTCATAAPSGATLLCRCA